MRRGFVERSMANLLAAAERDVFAEEIARRDGVLQKLDARVKLPGFLALIFAVALSHRLVPIGTAFVAAIALAWVSRLHAWSFMARVWSAALLFTAVIGLPAIVLTPGVTAFALPFGLAVTEQGIRSLAFLLARVVTAATLSMLLVLSTRWAELLAALRTLRVPLTFVVILGMTYRYIFVLLQSAAELFEGRRSRRVGRLTAHAERRLMTSTAGALLTRTMDLGSEIYLAMQARGFRGEVRTLRAPEMRRGDWIALTLFLGAAAALVAVGR